MTIVAKLPVFVMQLLERYLLPIRQWLSDQIYADLVARDPSHLLVRLKGHLNLTGLEQACSGFHHLEGRGAPPTYPVHCLVRALIVRYACNYSLRDLEWHIRFNLIVKWFVGYPIYATGPDHTTLERFEAWVCQHEHRAFFDQVLQQIDQARPDERQQVQIGDTYALRANAARATLIELIRDICHKLLATLEAADNECAALVKSAIDTVALFGPDPEANEGRLKAPERAIRLQAVVLAAQTCAAQVTVVLIQPTPLDQATRNTLGTWLDHLSKVLADNVVITVTPAPIPLPTPLPTPNMPTPPLTHTVPQCDRAQPAEACPAIPTSREMPQTQNAPDTLSVTELSKDKKGSFRLGSTTDPDATYRVHSKDGSKTDFGYNVGLLVSQHFIREIQVATGAQPDPVGLPDLLRAQFNYHGLIPPKVIYDAAAGEGKTRHLFNEATQGQSQLVAPLIAHDKNTPLFRPQQFTLSQEGLTLTCPNGIASSVAYPSQSGDARVFRFSATQCRGCPLWQQCRDPKQVQDANVMRQVFISDYRAEVEDARQYNLSDDFKADLKLRFRVEQLIAHQTRYNGGRVARFIGILKCDFQAKMNAMALNLKAWMKLEFPPKSPAKKPA